MMDFITLSNLNDLIDGVLVHPLKVNRDESGVLIEALKISWNDVYGEEHPFAQCYFSVTPPGGVRDKEVWHVHYTKQEDRFVVARGDIVTAIYDNRKESKTYGKLNLFRMGWGIGDIGQFMVLIPKGTLHGFAVVSDSEAVLLNFPTTLYDQKEEGRVLHKDANAKFKDGSIFNWDKVLAKIEKI